MHIPSGLEPLQQEAENDAPSDKKIANTRLAIAFDHQSSGVYLISISAKLLIRSSRDFICARNGSNLSSGSADGPSQRA